MTDEPPPASPALALLLDVEESVPRDAAGWLPPTSFFAGWAARSIAADLGPRPASANGAREPSGARRHELSVRLVASETMRELNRAWRGRDRPTNVLSFPADLPPLPLEDGASVRVLGDLVLCPEIVAREAREQGKPVEAHWAHLVVHGVLHLRGLDHEEEGEARVMEAQERRLLAARGIPDPYRARECASGADARDGAP